MGGKQSAPVELNPTDQTAEFNVHVEYCGK